MTAFWIKSLAVGVICCAFHLCWEVMKLIFAGRTLERLRKEEDSV